MNKGIVIQNLTNNYGKYGITREVLEPLIDDGVAEGFTYDLIYLSLEAELSKLAGQEFFCTSEDMARAFDMPVEEMNRIIEEAREELAANGENPDDMSNFASGSLYQLHKNYNFDVANPNTFYNVDGTSTGFDNDNISVGARAELDDDDCQ